jgi:hypothetical protein
MGFKGANLRRTLIAIGLQSLQQAQGVSFVSNYILVTLVSLGINTVVKSSRVFVRRLDLEDLCHDRFVVVLYSHLAERSQHS